MQLLITLLVANALAVTYKKNKSDWLEFLTKQNKRTKRKRYCIPELEDCEECYSVPLHL